MSEDLPDLMTTRQASELLNVTPATILRWAAAKRIPSIRFSAKSIRFRKSALLAKVQMVTVPRLRGRARSENNERAALESTGVEKGAS